jgi:mannosyltransferase OCH1-like enzyme
MRTLADSWVRNHPGWEYRLWTDAENRKFIKCFFPDFLVRYDSYPFHIQRVDAVRYFVLYSFGGLYVDLDFECLQPFDQLLADHECLLGLEPEEHCRIHNREQIIGNALMAAVPMHPLLGEVIRELVEYESVREDRNTVILETTGPFMLSRVYARCRLADVTLLPSRDVYPLSLYDLDRAARTGWSELERFKLREAYAVHYFAGTWWRMPAPPRPA